MKLFNCGMLKAPIAYSYKAKMAIQYENPYEVGLTGLLAFLRLIIACMNVICCYCWEQIFLILLHAC